MKQKEKHNVEMGIRTYITTQVDVKLGKHYALALSLTVQTRLKSILQDSADESFRGLSYDLTNVPTHGCALG